MSAMTPHDDHMPEGDDLVAAEYVLGVLPHDERLAAAHRAEIDRSFAARIIEWQKRFDPLSDDYRLAEPPRSLKPALDARLFGQGVSTSKRAGAAALWDRVGFWRGFAFATLLVAAVLGARIVMPVSQQPVASQMVASMEHEGSSVKTMALFDGKHNMMRVMVTAGSIPADRDMELWMIAGDNAPVSLGLVKHQGMTELPVKAEMAAKLNDGVMLAITDEPQGGSPGGTPTGAMLASGPIRTI